MSETHEHTPAHAGHGHGGHAEAELDRANVGVIGILLAATAIVLAIASYLLWIYFEREAEAVTYSQVLSRPSTELQALRARESEWLGTYGVVNKEQGQYRVPVDVGMKLFLQQASARRAGGQPQAIRAVQAAAPAEGTTEGAAPAGAAPTAPAAPAPQGPKAQ